MPKYSRHQPKTLLAVAKQTLILAPQKFGAVSRSVAWYPLLKMAGVGTGIVALLLWQWQLFVALGCGIGTMGAIYFAYDAPWEKYWDELYRLWQGEYRRLLLAVFGGGAVVFVSYLAIALWQSTANHWLASASVMQGVMIGAILLLTVGRSLSKSSQMTQFETSLEALGHRNSVKRLYAIRQLRQLLQSNLLNPEQKKTLYTFLRLTWQQETESPVRGALLSTLSLYKKSVQGSQTKQAAPQPLRLNNTHTRPALNLERLRHDQSVPEQV